MVAEEVEEEEGPRLHPACLTPWGQAAASTRAGGGTCSDDMGAGVAGNGEHESEGRDGF